MKVFRLSLNTSNRREAVKESHRLIVLMYDLEDRYNNKPNTFGDALLKIKQRYKNMSDVDELTQSIDDYQIRYTHGLRIVAKLQGIDPTSEDLGVQEFMGQFDQRDMECYELVKAKEKATSLSVANENLIVDTNAEITNKKSKLLSQCLEIFIDLNKHWSISTEIEYKYKINLFIKIVTDKPISQLTKADVNDYSEKLIQLPSNAHNKPKYKSKSITELLAIDIPEDDLIKPATIDNHFGKVFAFLSKMIVKGYITDRYIHEPI